MSVTWCRYWWILNWRVGKWYRGDPKKQSVFSIFSIFEFHLFQLALEWLHSNKWVHHSTAMLKCVLLINNSAWKKKIKNLLPQPTSIFSSSGWVYFLPLAPNALIKFSATLRMLLSGRTCGMVNRASKDIHHMHTSRVCCDSFPSSVCSVWVALSSCAVTFHPGLSSHLTSSVPPTLVLSHTHHPSLLPPFFKFLSLLSLPTFLPSSLTFRPT